MDYSEMTPKQARHEFWQDVRFGVMIGVSVALVLVIVFMT